MVGGLTVLGALRLKRLDQIAAYDVKILEQRLVEYRKLWKLTSQTSRRKIASFDENAGDVLADKLTNWYYDDGGMFLSERARDAFFEARASLQPEKVGASRLQNWQDQVVNTFSSLRTALCDDVASRRAPSAPKRET